MSENKFLKDPRFEGITPFEKKVWLSTPTMHGEEQKWVDDAIAKNWVSTVGENINEVEKQIAEYDTRFAVATEYNAEDYKAYDELKSRYDHLMHEWEKASYEVEVTEQQ